MLSLFISPQGLSLTSQALLARAYELPVYVTDLEQKTAGEEGLASERQALR